MYVILSLVVAIAGGAVIGSTIPDPHSFYLSFMFGVVSGAVGCVLQDILG